MGQIYQAGVGVLTGVVNTPVRYQHTAITCAHLTDIANAADLISQALSRIEELLPHG